MKHWFFGTTTANPSTTKVLSKFGHYIPALSAMHPDREPHPNCGVSKDEIEFMRNVINGKRIFVKSYYVMIT